MSATNFSSDSLVSKTANFEEVSLSGGLTLTGDADLQGNTNLATTTATSVHVGSLTSDSGAYLSEGGVWVNSSSLKLKENLAAIKPQSVLERITALPIYAWNYKSQNASIIHIGPMAEDFYASFGVGESSTTVSTIDPAGVALAGIQALDEKIKSVFDFKWILESLKVLGMEISEGLMKVKALAAEALSVESLEIGSSEAPTGFTIYDRATLQPVCVFSENNILKSQAGRCGDSAPQIEAKPDSPAVDQDIEQSAQDLPADEMPASNSANTENLDAAQPDQGNVNMNSVSESGTEAPTDNSLAQPPV